MLHKLIELKRPCSTFVLKWINYLNKQTRSLHGFTLLSLQRSSSILHYRKEQEMLFSSLNVSFDYKYKIVQKGGPLLRFRVIKGEQSNDHHVSISEWENIENDILSKAPGLSTAHMDFSIMVALEDKPDISASFMRYVKSKRQPDITCLAIFFQNCAEKHEDFVLDEYENLLKTYDATKISLQAKYIIKALIKTRLWRQSVEILEDSLRSNITSVGHIAYYKLLRKILKHKDYELFVRIWDKVKQTNFRVIKALADEFYTSWKEGEVPMDLLLELFQLDELTLDAIQASGIQNYINREWRAEASVNVIRVPGRTECPLCKSKLDKDVIEGSIFKEMGKAVCEKMLSGSNVLEKPDQSDMREELGRFREFLRLRKTPFDYIFDWSHILCNNRFTEDKDLIAILKWLNRRGKNALVIASEGYVIDAVCTKWADMFTVRQNTQEEVFLLMAAFSSGPHCYVVTNDKLNEHIRHAAPPIVSYFRRWRSTRIVRILGQRLLYPTDCRWKAQESNRAWHIPFQDKPECKNSSTKSVSTKRFLCIQKLDYTPSAELTSFRKAKHTYLNKKGKRALLYQNRH